MSGKTPPQIRYTRNYLNAVGIGVFFKNIIVKILQDKGKKLTKSQINNLLSRTKQKNNLNNLVGSFSLTNLFQDLTGEQPTQQDLAQLRDVRKLSQTAARQGKNLKTGETVDKPKSLLKQEKEAGLIPEVVEQLRQKRKQEEEEEETDEDDDDDLPKPEASELLPLERIRTEEMEEFRDLPPLERRTRQEISSAYDKLLKDILSLKDLPPLERRTTEEIRRTQPAPNSEIVNQTKSDQGKFQLLITQPSDDVVGPEPVVQPRGDVEEDIVQQVESGKQTGNLQDTGEGLPPFPSSTEIQLSNDDIRDLIGGEPVFVNEFNDLSNSEQEIVASNTTNIINSINRDLQDAETIIDSESTGSREFRKEKEKLIKLLKQPKRQLYKYIATGTLKYGRKNPIRSLAGFLTILAGAIGVGRELLTDTTARDIGIVEQSIDVPQQVIQQDEGSKGTLRPKFIIPTDKILELTGNEVNTDLLEFTAFDYVLPTSEGALGNVRNNPLKRQAEIQERILMDGAGMMVDSVYGEELPYSKEQLNTLLFGEKLPRMEFKPMSNYEVGDNQIEPFDWTGDRTAIEALSPYRNFTNVHQTNKGFENSVLYGYQP